MSITLQKMLAKGHYHKRHGLRYTIRPFAQEQGSSEDCSYDKYGSKQTISLCVGFLYCLVKIGEIKTDIVPCSACALAHTSSTFPGFPFHLGRRFSLQDGFPCL